MHISDTHLGSVQYGIPERENDFYEAFREGIQVGIDREVDFIIHSGDLFDSARPSNRALRVAEEAMVLLQKSNIPVFSIAGDHDRPKVRDNPSHILFDLFGLKIMGMDGFQSTVFRKGGEEVFIGGVGNMKMFMREKLKEEYDKASKEAANHKISVFMSHQGVSPMFPPESSEAREDQLPVNYNYLAFGHVHQFNRRIIGRALFSYAGSTEVKSTNEISGLERQGKGVNIIETDGENTELERVILKSVRVQKDLTGTMDECFGKLDALNAKEYGKKPVITMHIHGRPNIKYLREKLSEYKEKFIMRQPIIEENPDAVLLAPSFEENIESIFTKYFSDEKKGHMALSIYNLIKDGRNSDDDIMKICGEVLNDN